MSRPIATAVTRRQALLVAGLGACAVVLPLRLASAGPPVAPVTEEPTDPYRLAAWSGLVDQVLQSSAGPLRVDEVVDLARPPESAETFRLRLVLDGRDLPTSMTLLIEHPTAGQVALFATTGDGVATVVIDRRGG